MPMPRPDAATVAFFTSVLPKDPTVSTRPMFGNLAAFANGYMFSGLFGNDLFVRLGDADQARLLEEEGAKPFEPMEGRPMTGYICVPAAWRGEPATVKKWVARSLAHVNGLPPKEAKKAKKPSAKKTQPSAKKTPAKPEKKTKA